MGRIALFVAVVGGLVWVALGRLAGGSLPPMTPVTRVSLAVIAAVVLWTALAFRFADRQGRDGRGRKGPGGKDSGGGNPVRKSSARKDAERR